MDKIKFNVPSHCNDKGGRSEPKKNSVSQAGKNKPMGEKMTMKGKDTKMAASKYGSIYQK